MKLRTTLLAAVILVSASCRKESVVTSVGGEICFGQLTTRTMTDVTSLDTTGFYCMGYDNTQGSSLFGSQKFAKEAGVYRAFGSPQYFPANSTPIQFFASYPVEPTVISGLSGLSRFGISGFDPKQSTYKTESGYPIQILHNGNFAEGELQGWSIWGTATCTLTNGVYRYVSHDPNSWNAMVKTSLLTIGHKYVAIEKVRYVTIQSGKRLCCLFGSGTVNETVYPDRTTTDWQIIAMEHTVTAKENIYYEFLRFNDAPDGATAELAWATLYDLTAMYGEGNEPTKAEFVAQYGDKYYPYTTNGTITVCKMYPFEHDLVVATTTGDHSPVGLAFDHILTKLTIVAVAADSEYSYYLTSLVLTIPSTGDYSIADGRWYTHDTYDWDYFSHSGYEVFTEGTQIGDTKTIVPGLITFTASWTCKKNGQTMATYTKEGSFTPEVGDNNTYRLTLGNDAASLQINASLQGWEDGGSVDANY